MLRGVWVVERVEPDSPTGRVIVSIWPTRERAWDAKPAGMHLRYIPWGPSE